MQKYSIDKEFSIIKNFKPPFLRLVFPFANLFLNLFKPRSNKNVNVKKIVLSAGNTNFLNYLITPKNARKEIPCLIYVHGGGFAYKFSPSHIKLMKEYAVKANCAVFAADYSLSPKEKFPKAIDETTAAYLYISKHSEEFSIDKNKLILGGDSAGGNIAAATTIKLLKDHNITSNALLLIYPVLDATMTTKSMKTYTDTPMWNSKLNKKMWRYYVAEKEDLKDPLISPIFFDELSKFPKTYIETAEFDCLHDEGILFAEKLNENGVDVTLFETLGTMHGFDTLTSKSISKNAIEKRIEFLKSVFKRD